MEGSDPEDFLAWRVAFDSHEQKPRKPARKQRTTEVTAIAHTRLLNLNVVYKHSPDAHATTSIAAAPLLSYIIRPSLLCSFSHHRPLLCRHLLLSFCELFFSTTCWGWPFCCPHWCCCFFPPVHRSYLTSET